ncbi:LysR family transcriptional regulator [Craterilacuibacter sp.]|uniref:LysR family transcriptional regulator n=1 Tax=Craterilacuibacter sp. TaxID=2870909 RepID=UPI003F411D8D
MTNPLWLRSFVAITETGSFTRAADKLDLTQAAVSQHLQRLEAEYGPLLLRRTRVLELTPAGHKLLGYAAEIASATARLHSSLSNDDAHHGELSLVTPGSIGLALYPQLLALQQAHPGLVIKHRFAPSAEIIDAVLHNQAELGIVATPPDDGRLQVQRFASESLCLVLPASVTGASWEDLLGLGFIDHPDGHDMASRLLSRRFPGMPLHALPRRGFINQIGLILEPVARGLGFTVLPHFAVQAFEHQSAIRIATDGAEVIDTLWLIHRAEWPLSARASLALTALHAQFGD